MAEASRSLKQVVEELVFTFKHSAELSDDEILECHCGTSRSWSFTTNWTMQMFPTPPRKVGCTMPISMGIACEKCGVVYVVSKAAGVQIDYMPCSAGPGMFILACTARGRITSFHKSDLKPYTLSTRSAMRGHARPGEYIAQIG
jgi:hypothetical protein